MSVISPNLVVRRLTIDDFEDVVELLNELTEGIPVASGEEGRERFSKLLAHEAPQSLVWRFMIGSFPAPHCIFCPT